MRAPNGTPGIPNINIILMLASAVIHDMLVPDENLDSASGVTSTCMCSMQPVI